MRHHEFDFNVLQKNSSGVYKIPLSKLADLRFTEVPFYSTVEIDGLPGSLDTYRLHITAMHGGGPNDEFFYLNFHVQFQVPGNSNNETTVKICKRKNTHIKRFFSNTAHTLGLENGPDWVPYFEENSHLFGDVLFSCNFTRTEDPVLIEAMKPFVKRFKEFLKSKDLLLFICHASEDKPFVDILAMYLDSCKLDLWYDKREIKVGDSIVSRINDGLDAASHVVVVLSNASAEKPWVKREMSAALMKQLQDRSIIVIPLLREDCRIPALLADIKYADCRTDQDSGFKQLVDAIIGTKTDEAILVYDLGGGTVDRAMVKIKDKFKGKVDVATLKKDLLSVAVKHERLIKKKNRDEKKSKT
jgi:hypothetical protein